MRGQDGTSGSLFSYVDLDARVPARHPLRAMRGLVNDALARLDASFEALYRDGGRPSIPPERLLRATMLQLLYSIRSERQLAERLEFDLQFHWFVGLGIDDAVFDAVGSDFGTAFLAVLRVFALNAFYRFSHDTCMEVSVKSVSFSMQAPGLKDTDSAKAIDVRHAQWRKQLPEMPADLWMGLMAFDHDSRQALFAHCAALGINAVHEPWNRNKEKHVHADHLARAAGLDMVAAGWQPTTENYLGRVSKARILEAVREGKGEREAQLIEHLKKGDMATEAERLLAGSGWLPEPLRTAESASADETPAETGDVGEEALPAFLAIGDGDAEILIAAE